MRPWHLPILLMLAAVPVVLALLLGGGSGRDRQSAPPAGAVAQVSLHLIDGTDGGPANACQVTHHVKAFRSGEQIRFRGGVSGMRGRPPGAKVVIKLKACVNGLFSAAGEIVARIRQDGTLKGGFRAPVPGIYFARAKLSVGGTTIAHSGKRYFLTR